MPYNFGYTMPGQMGSLPPHKSEYEKLQGYYQDYLNTFWGGSPYITPYQEQFFTEQERWIQNASGKMEKRAMQNVAARGVAGAGIGGDYMAQYVYDPLAQAEAQLGTERARLISEEQARRQGIAMQLALKKQQEEKERGGSILGTIGKVIGTVGGAALGFVGGGGFNPLTAIAGAQAGYNILGGGGGGENPALDMAMMQKYMEETKGQGTPQDYMNWYRDYYQQFMGNSSNWGNPYGVNPYEYITP